MQAGVKMQVEQIAGSEYREYFRVLRDMQLEGDQSAVLAQFKNVLENVLVSSPVALQLNANNHSTELLEPVITALKGMNNVFMMNQ